MKRTFAASVACFALSIAQCLFFAGVLCGADESWEKLPNGILGRVADFEGADGVKIAGYVRKPDAPGPIPMVIVLHGGGATARPVKAEKEEDRPRLMAAEALRASQALGRASNPPITEFLAQGWAVYSLDFRPNSRYPIDPLEFDDTVVAIHKAKSFSYVDPKRIAMLGGSHGGHVTGRMASRAGLCCAVLCAPAGLDLILLSHLGEKGTPLGGNQGLIRQMEQRAGVKMAEIEKNPDAYHYSSLLTEVPQVQCPILMISGRNDPNAPLAAMDTYVDKLRAAGKEAETYHPDNGPHGFYFAVPKAIPETAESTRQAIAFIKKHFAQSDVGTLRVAIRDKQSGQIVPAMICITSLADNTWRKPPDGRQPAGYVTNPNIIKGRLMGPEYVAGTETSWYPGDPGPAVLMNGDFPEDPLDATRPYTEQKRKRNLWYDGKPAVPFWKDPAAYFVSRPFDITLPAGKWRLSVMRGIEYLPVFDEFTVTAGQELQRDVQLARWVDMPQQGWYSADAHVHSPRVAPSQDEYIITWAKSMDVHMTCVLSYADRRPEFGAVQARYGRPSRYQQGDYWLESGHEDPREPINEQGHVTQLNIQKIVRDLSRYQLYDYTFDGVHEQGGLVGYTHLAWSGEFFRRTNPELNPGWDASINAIRGKIDFIDILEAARLGVDDYYDFLNMGVKLTAMASSDNPAAVVGEQRSYAYTGPGNFTVDTWYAAVKQGHTFVSNGPMLLLRVNDVMPGDEMRVAKNAKLRIRVETWAPELIGTPKLLEVVSHGRVIRSVESPDPNQEKLAAEFELPAGESQWLAARTTAFNGAVAHTSPVYVIVDGANFLDRSQLPQLVAKRLKVLEFIESRMRNSRFTKGYAPGVADELLKRVADARAKYLALEHTP